LALAPNKTLGDLITDMQMLLGYGAQTQVSTVQKELFTRFLQMAQAELLLQFGDMLRERVNLTAVTTAIDSNLYDIPNDCDPYKIYTVAVKVGTGWRHMEKGIPLLVQGKASTANSVPTRYNIRYGTGIAQIELWNTPDAIYTIGMHYQLNQDSFSLLTDTASVNADLLLLFAMSAAAAHYNHRDSDRYASRVEAALRKLKMAQHDGLHYRKRGYTAPGKRGPGTGNYNVSVVDGVVTITGALMFTEGGQSVLLESS